MRKQNDGSKAQDLAQQAFVHLESHAKFSWVRLYDSKAAGIGSGGNFIPEQYADYIVLNNGCSGLVEVKSSVVARSLLACPVREYFKDIQILGARMWRRARGNAFCFFYSSVSETVELWDMQPIVDAWRAPPRQRKLKAEPLATCSPVTEQIAEILKTHIKG